MRPFATSASQPGHATRKAGSNRMRNRPDHSGIPRSNPGPPRRRGALPYSERLALLARVSTFATALGPPFTVTAEPFASPVRRFPLPESRRNPGSSGFTVVGFVRWMRRFATSAANTVREPRQAVSNRVRNRPDHSGIPPSNPGPPRRRGALPYSERLALLAPVSTFATALGPPFAVTAEPFASPVRHFPLPESRRNPGSSGFPVVGSVRWMRPFATSASQPGHATR
jgi:hypothetical protein